MFRSRPLAAAILCTAALAACSDSPAGTARDSDALVNATNRNLPSAVVFEAAQSETVTPGALQPASICYHEPYYSAAGTESNTDGDAVNALPCDGDPYEPPVEQPVFAYPVVNITGTTSVGVKTVDLTASGSFTYASFGQLTAIFQNSGGCSIAPSEYSRSVVTAQNAPFTLSASRNASYNGTTSYINWGVRGISYAESPEGGSNTKTSTTTKCY